MEKANKRQSKMKLLNQLAKKANSGDKDALDQLNDIINSDPEVTEMIKRLKRKAKRIGKQEKIARTHSRSNAYGSVYSSLSGHTSAKTWKTTK